MHPCAECGEGEFRYPGDRHRSCITTEIRPEWQPSYQASTARHRETLDDGWGEAAPPARSAGTTMALSRKPASRPTDKQVRYLRWLGYGGPTPNSRLEASNLIEQTLRRRGRRS